MNHSGSEWIKSALNKKPSTLGAKVADLLGHVFGGIYHLDDKDLLKANWESDHHITVRLSHKQLATWDSSNLTWLVVLCHDNCMRMSINAVGRDVLELMFHQRRLNEGVMEGHPTMDEHLKIIRTHCPLPAASA